MGRPWPEQADWSFRSGEGSWARRTRDVVSADRVIPRGDPFPTVEKSSRRSRQVYAPGTHPHRGRTGVGSSQAEYAGTCHNAPRGRRVMTIPDPILRVEFTEADPRDPACSGATTRRSRIAIKDTFAHLEAAGRVAEWFKAAVLKFGSGHPA